MTSIAMTSVAIMLALSMALLVTACDDNDPPPSPLPRELAPVDVPGPTDITVPHRERPRAIVEARGRIFVALGGTDTKPERQLAVLDAASLEVIDRLEVGPSPYALAVHPGGRFIAVACRYASYVPIVDAERLEVVAEVPTPFYAEDIAFSPDGLGAVVTNRWKDSLLRWRVAVDGDRFSATPLDRLSTALDPVGIPLDDNPLRVRYVDNRRVLVTSETSLSVTMVDVVDGRILARHSPNAPVIDALLLGDYVIALHTGGGTAHPPDEGFDGDHDGMPGDGTANIGFQDLQNEIDVLRATDLSLVHRYTSDSICCADYRDVNPDAPNSGLDLLPDDVWPPERVAFLPPRDTWIVAGAMPERAVAITRPDGTDALAVLYGGSSEVQTFDIDPDTGALSPRETAETGLYTTGHGAMDLLWREEDRALLIVERLAETVSRQPLILGAPREPHVVGDVSEGAFPATDAELGEAFNTMTALFSVDGDQTCVHCHRDGSPVGKAVSMPLLESPTWGVRSIMAYRGAADTRPWFVEAAMEEDNFFPVINELARRENFCCEQNDVRVWSHYPTHEACVADGTLAGCSHVLDCESDPPPECAARGYGGVALTRDSHFRSAAMRVLGRSESFGDALYTERLGPDGTITRRPIPLGFDGTTRALGIFLLADSRLLPNPNAAVASSRAEVGQTIFLSPRTGCATCHPLPTGATATETDGPLRFPYVISPVLVPLTDADADRVNPAFLGSFPDARQTSAGLRIGATSLRGLWDRNHFLHHGLATSLREAIATPEHPALHEGERGMNELFGQPDTHGSTSGLTADELNALVTFLDTL